MPGLNKNRKRPNTIAFHVSNEEKVVLRQEKGLIK